MRKQNLIIIFTVLILAACAPAMKITPRFSSITPTAFASITPAPTAAPLPFPEPAPTLETVQLVGLYNCRAAPNVDAEILAGIPAGAIVPVTRRRDGWFQTQYGEVICWLSNRSAGE